MAQSERDPHTQDVRRFALGTYVPPILAFVVIVGALLFYWRQSPPPDATIARDKDVRAEGTTGTERSGGEKTPGGHSPDTRPSSTEQEIADRGGHAITELGEVFERDGRDTIGRRVELKDIDVERVESAALFWIRDGNARIAVSVPPGVAPPQAGQSIDVAGTVERHGESVRIRASRVESSR